MTTFWLQLIIQEAIGVAGAFITVAVGAKRPKLASDLEAMLALGQTILTDIQTGV